MTSPNPHRVERVASEAHRLIAVRNASLWGSLWTGLRGPFDRGDIERLVEMAYGDIEVLEGAARKVTERYDDASAMDGQRLLRRAVLYRLSGGRGGEQHSPERA